MQEYNVGSSTIYDIKAQKGKLLPFFASYESNKAVEQCCSVYFSLKRLEGAPISGPMLVEKAKDFYKQMQLSEPCAFSDGWLSCFELCHGIRKLPVSGEHKLADHKAAEKYCEFFRNLIEEFEGFKVKVRKNTLAQILEMVKDTPSSHPINKLHEMIHTVTDTEIIENVLNPETSKNTDRDSEEEDFSEEDKITLRKASSVFDTIIKFAERQPCYTAQEVMQLHVLRSTFMQKRQKTINQADIRDLFKKAASGCGTGSVQIQPNLPHLLHLQ
uniref:HTH CENPB-type domain-containing protein n=1 Tax=Chelonoidis abingdonii TaxID=106734 RepID=A0A8C0IT06_CHEAB